MTPQTPFFFQTLYAHHVKSLERSTRQFGRRSKCHWDGMGAATDDRR